MNFDPTAFADDIVKLQRRARYLPLVFAICGLLLGMSIAVIAGMFNYRGGRSDPDALIPPLALTGAVLGFFMGRSRALAARLQAHLLFRQLEGK
jgi:hypothetical protein